METITSQQIFKLCNGTGDGSNNDFLLCITDQLLIQQEKDRESNRDFSRKINLVGSAALVFFMQAGTLPHFSPFDFWSTA